MLNSRRPLCETCQQPLPLAQRVCLHCLSQEGWGGGGAPPDDDDDLPDWLKDDPLKDDDLPDWMNNPSPASSSASKPTSDDDSSLDWLNDDADDSLPDWMKDDKDDIPSTSWQPPHTGPLDDTDSLRMPAASPEEPLDWMRDVEPPKPKKSQTDALAEESVEDLTDASMPEWLESELPQSDPVESGEVPEWLADSYRDEPKTASTQPKTPAFDITIGTGPLTTPPEWLADVEDDLPEIAPAAAPSDDLPAWLRAGLQDDDEESVDAPAFTNAEIDVDDVTRPGWLDDEADAETESAAVAAAPPTPTATPDEEGDIDLPDWLREGSSDSQVEDSLPRWLHSKSGPAALPGTGSLEVPAWLQNTGDEDSVAADLSAEEIAEDAPPDWLKPDPALSAGDDDEDTRTWTEGGDFEALRTGARTTKTGQLEVPDWLQEAEGQASIGLPPTDEGVPTVPEWLRAASDLEDGEFEDDVFGLESEDPLAAAAPENRFADVEIGMMDGEQDLETVLGEAAAIISKRSGPFTGPTTDPSVDLHEEKAGPLAGMKGVIRAEPVISLYGLPGGSIMGPKVTPTQTDLAERLSQALQAELDETEIAVRGRKKRRLPIERLVLTAVLLLAVMVPVLLGQVFQGFPAPFAAGSPAGAFINQVAQTPADRPVLIAFDYDPGSSGELDVATQAVLRQLQQRDIPVVAVSTRYAGIGTADRLLQQVFGSPAGNADGPAFSQYINLGYIPGGPMGLQAFAQRVNMVRGANFLVSSVPAPTTRNLPVLAGLTTNSVNDFGLIIVVAGNPEDLRAWIEQVAAQPGVETPMVAITLASVRPMAVPYYQADGSGALVGLLSGMEEAFVYTNQTGGVERRAISQLDVTSVGQLVSGGLLLIGLAIGVIQTLNDRQKQNRAQAAPAPKPAAAVSTPKPTSRGKRRK